METTNEHLKRCLNEEFYKGSKIKSNKLTESFTNNDTEPNGKYTKRHTNKHIGKSSDMLTLLE